MEKDRVEALRLKRLISHVDENTKSKYQNKLDAQSLYLIAQIN